MRICEDVNRHAPHRCEKCNIWFEVQGEPAGGYKVVEVPEPQRDWKFEYEQALESRELSIKREDEWRLKAADWEAAYWALVKAVRK